MVSSTWTPARVHRGHQVSGVALEESGHNVHAHFECAWPSCPWIPARRLIVENEFLRQANGEFRDPLTKATYELCPQPGDFLAPDLGATCAELMPPWLFHGADLRARNANQHASWQCPPNVFPHAPPLFECADGPCRVRYHALRSSRFG